MASQHSLHRCGRAPELSLVDHASDHSGRFVEFLAGQETDDPEWATVREALNSVGDRVSLRTFRRKLPALRVCVVTVTVPNEWSFGLYKRRVLVCRACLKGLTPSEFLSRAYPTGRKRSVYLAASKRPKKKVATESAKLAAAATSPELRAEEVGGALAESWASRRRGDDVRITRVIREHEDDERILSRAIHHASVQIRDRVSVEAAGAFLTTVELCFGVMPRGDPLD